MWVFGPDSQRAPISSISHPFFPPFFFPFLLVVRGCSTSAPPRRSDSQPSQSIPGPPVAKTCPASSMNVTTKPFWKGSRPLRKGTNPGYGAGTYCRSDPGLGRADPASRWQSAWQHGESGPTAPAPWTGRGSALKMRRARPALGPALLNIASAHGLDTSWDIPILFHYQFVCWPTSTLISQHPQVHIHESRIGQIISSIQPAMQNILLLRQVLPLNIASKCFIT